VVAVVEVRQDRRQGVWQVSYRKQCRAMRSRLLANYLSGEDGQVARGSGADFKCLAALGLVSALQPS